jgi:hypothetical protein
MQWRTQEFFFGGGGPTNSVEERGQREQGLGALAPQSGVPLYLQMSETRILIRLLQMYFPRNWEFCSALSKVGISGLGGGFEPPNLPRFRH